MPVYVFKYAGSDKAPKENTHFNAPDQGTAESNFAYWHDHQTFLKKQQGQKYAFNPAIAGFKLDYIEEE